MQIGTFVSVILSLVILSSVIFSETHLMQVRNHFLIYIQKVIYCFADNVPASGQKRKIQANVTASSASNGPSQNKRQRTLKRTRKLYNSSDSEEETSTKNDSSKNTPSKYFCTMDYL